MKLYERFSNYISATQFISAIFQLYQRNSIYIGDFPIISAQLDLHRRFSNYISATRFISAIFQLYQRNSIYIGDFPIISAQLDLYRRFSNYISATRFISTYRQNLTIYAKERGRPLWQPPPFLEE